MSAAIIKETTHMTSPITSNTLSVNVFTAPGKAMVGERPRPFGEALGFDPITSTLIFGEHDAVLAGGPSLRVLQGWGLSLLPALSRLLPAAEA